MHEQLITDVCELLLGLSVSRLVHHRRRDGRSAGGGEGTPWFWVFVVRGIVEYANFRLVV